MTGSATLVRFGGYQPPRSVHTRAAEAFLAALRKRLGDDVETRFTPSIAATGRPVSDLLTMTEAGELDLCYFASSYIAHRVPELTVLDLPFDGADRARIWAKLDGAAGASIRRAVEAQTGYAVLGFWDNGVRHISNGVRPIRCPRDCEGLSIRTLDNAFHKSLFAAMGFRPRFIDVKDLAEAVRSRSIDAQENPLTNIVNFAIQETHRYVSLTGHFFGIALLLVNRRWLEARPPHMREAVLAAAAEATTAQRGFAAEEDAQCLATLRAAGCEIVSPGEIDLAAFKAVVAPIVAREVAALDPGLLALWRG